MASYTVSTGDTLSAIAKRNKTTVAELLRLNPKLTSDPKYKDGNVIFNGTKITLPSSGSSTPAKTTTPTLSAPPPVVTASTPTAPDTTASLATIIAPTFASPADDAQRKLNAYGLDSLTSSERILLGLPPLPEPAPLVTPTEAQPIPTIALPEIFQSQVQAMPDVYLAAPGTPDPSQPPVGTEFLIDPFTGKPVYDKYGQPVKVKMGGDSNAYFDYLAGVSGGKRTLQAAGAANKLAVEKATATGDTSTRAAEREIYKSQQRALNELSRRGLSGAPGLTRAAKRAYGAAPLSERLEAIRKMQSEITGANLLLAQQQSAEQAAEEQRQLELTKATGIANQLGGK
jgi:hypothetical protein